MGKSLNAKRIALDSLMVLLLLGIGREWLHTLPYFTDTETHMLWLFAWPFVALLLLHRLLPWAWVRFFTSFLFIIVWFQQTLWEGNPFFSLGWVKETAWMVRQSLPDMIRMDWLSIDPILRTGLFYVLIWAIVYVLYRRILLQKKVLGMLLLTISYLAILDTFILFDGKWPVVRVFMYGFLLLALVNLQRIEGLIRRRITHHRLMPWFMTAVLLLGSVGWMSYVVPKSDASWPDPVSFIQSLKGGSGGSGGVAQSGYGDGDNRLGGAFELTDNVILEGIVGGERYPLHYWRGESKDFYSGHGWESTLHEEQPFLFEQMNPLPLVQPSAYAEVRERVSFYEPTNLVFTSGQPELIMPLLFVGDEAIEPGSIHGVINPDTYRIEANHAFGIYDAVSLVPQIDEDTLITNSKLHNDSTETYPQSIMDVYTQLPDALPERIGLLAEQVIASETNIYKKVKRIENYLRWSGLQYRTSAIPYPEEGQDFVDQFLFDTRRGYCDHFSTSMVVMLRTQGIPARWVKGYTFGELESRSANTHVVTVKGKNAHSWVEVYFPSIGWLPFEPTASFNYPFEIIRATETVESAPVAVVTPSITQLLEQERAKDQQKEIAKKQETTKRAFQKWTPWAVAGIVLLLGAVLLFFFREGLYYRLQEAAMKRADGSQLVYRGYQLLLRQLGRSIGVRADDQTIREYTGSLDWKPQQKEDLQQWTRAFEETRYGEKEPTLAKDAFIHAWKRLLQKMRS